MDVERRNVSSDRRAHRRGGRREGDSGKPWYMRRRLWLAAASLAYMGWRRVRAIAPVANRRDRGDKPHVAA